MMGILWGENEKFPYPPFQLGAVRMGYFFKSSELKQRSDLPCSQLESMTGPGCIDNSQIRVIVELEVMTS